MCFHWYELNAKKENIKINLVDSVDDYDFDCFSLQVSGRLVGMKKLCVRSMKWRTPYSVQDVLAWDEATA